MSDEPSANLHDPDVLTEALRLAQERMPSGGTADEFYTRPDGVAEAAWMRPHRELVDGLGVTAGTRRALHAMVDEVYAQGRVDADEEAGAARQLAQAILSRALQLAAPEPSAVQRLRDAANEADSGPRAAELHQAADEAEAAHTDEAAVDAAESAFDRWWVGESRVGLDPTQAERALWVSVVEAVGPLIAARVRAEERQRAVPEALRGIAAEVHARYPLLGEPDPISDWASGVVWMLTRLEGIADDFAAGSAVPVATPEHDAGCERAYGQAVCFCQRRADVQFSHTAGPVAAPQPCQLCSAGDHAACSAARQDSYCCCPVPFAGPVVATSATCGCRTVAVWVGDDGADGEFAPCERHQAEDIARRTAGPVATPTEPAPPSYERPHGPHCYPWDWQYGDNEPNCEHRRPAEQDGQR